MQTCLDKRVIHQSWAEGQLKAYYPDNSSVPLHLKLLDTQSNFTRWFSLLHAPFKENDNKVDSHSQNSHFINPNIMFQQERDY